MQRRAPSFYRKRRFKQQEIKYRVNLQIRVPQVFIIDENGKPLGEMRTTEALNLAHERELDLVEVQPTARPPICKMLNYGQFQYTQEKHKQKQKAKQKKVEIKGVRLTFRISDHDKEIRQAQAQKFLEHGNKVNVDLVLKGRERAYIREAKELMENFVQNLGENVCIEQPFSKQGGKLSLIVARKS